MVVSPHITLNPVFEDPKFFFAVGNNTVVVHLLRHYPSEALPKLLVVPDEGVARCPPNEVEQRDTGKLEMRQVDASNSKVLRSHLWL